MEIGILGLARSGKSTLFQIMTGINSSEMYGEQFVRGIAKVPDLRFDKLVGIFKPAKVSPAIIPFIDVNASGENAWNTVRQSLMGVDGILHIIDSFSSSSINEIVKKYQTLADELVISDLMIVENRLSKLEKLPKNALKPDETKQMKVLPKAKEQLEAGKPLRDLDISEDEMAPLRNFAFWTLRPELIVLNIEEGSSELADEFKKTIDTTSPVIEICALIEAEIATLPKEDQKEFLDSAGIKTPAFEKIIQTAFSQLGRMFYFTVGEDEVKAWVINKNSTAPKAAAAIHKDFERGFIKAEVVSYDDFIAYGETLASAKSSGKLRLEGKEYIVQDGDIISFRFNV